MNRIKLAIFAIFQALSTLFASALCALTVIDRPAPHMGVQYALDDLFKTVTRKKYNHFFVLLGNDNQPLTDYELTQNPERIASSSAARAWGSRVGLLRPSVCWESNQLVTLHEDKALIRYLINQKRLPHPNRVAQTLKKEAYKLVNDYKRLTSYFVLKVNQSGKLDPINGIAYRFYIGNPLPKPYVIQYVYKRGKGRVPVLRGQAARETRMWNFKQSLLGSVVAA